MWGNIERCSRKHERVSSAYGFLGACVEHEEYTHRFTELDSASSTPRLLPYGIKNPLWRRFRNIEAWVRTGWFPSDSADESGHEVQDFIEDWSCCTSNFKRRQVAVIRIRWFTRTSLTWLRGMQKWVRRSSGTILKSLPIRLKISDHQSCQSHIFLIWRQRILYFKWQGLFRLLIMKLCAKRFFACFWQGLLLQCSCHGHP